MQNSVTNRDELLD